MKISRSLRWTGSVARMGDRIGLYSVLVGRSQTKRHSVRPRHRWEDIKMNLQHVGWEIDWINVTQERNRRRAFVNTVLDHQFP